MMNEIGAVKYLECSALAQQVLFLSFVGLHGDHGNRKIVTIFAALACG